MRSGTVAVVSLLCALVAGGSIGCGENTQSLYIVGNLVPDSTCEVRPSDVGPFRGSGALDLVVGGSYRVFPMVRNDMPSSLAMHEFEPMDGRLEAHNVFLKRATVSYSYDPNIILPSVESKTVPITGFVSNSGSLTAFEVEIIDEDMARRLAQKLQDRDSENPSPGGGMIVDIQVVGETADGTELTTNVLSFPLRVCKGCLLSFPPEADVQGDFSPEFDCNDLSASVGSEPCRLGQDEPVDCRLCKRGKPVAEQSQCDPL